MINKIIALFKKKPVPAKPMATRNEERNAKDFDEFLKDFEELEVLNDD